jgi:hypothetical protein
MKCDKARCDRDATKVRIVPIIGESIRFCNECVNAELAEYGKDFGWEPLTPEREAEEASCDAAILKSKRLLREVWRPMERVEAPWTDDQVASLNAYQEAGFVHPFTYGDGADQVDLIATTSGWVAKEGGPVVQTWAHMFMADWSWRGTGPKA